MNVESQSYEGSPKRQDLIVLALAAGLLYFLALGQRDLWNPNEPIYGRAVAEMAQDEDWLVPTVNDRVFAEKPILYFWTALLSAELLGGVNELSLRVPAALAGIASAFLTFAWVLPYVGRRRAFTTAALFATVYQVFWASRSVQMDIFVLASTLGVLVPLTHFLDFERPAARAWLLAGLAAGLGFAAKGPVTLVLPGLVIFAYALSTRRLTRLLSTHALLGAAVALLVSTPWYLTLWAQGEASFLHEVLIRQNFMRFVDAWDHRQPWWYFLKYLWIDYAPWSWLLPAAALTAPQGRKEGKLQRQSWIWIAAILFFFSLSESKRAPYILPIAPAVAALAAIVVDRSARRLQPEGAAKVLTGLAFGGLGTVFALGGLAMLSPWVQIPGQLRTLSYILGILMAAWGVSILAAQWLVRDRPALAPALLLYGLTALYVGASVWVLPAVDPMKSARLFAGEIDRRVTVPGKPIASYRFWDWRAGYLYYADRTIPNLKRSGQLTAFW
ncbi:MAG: glycosyltransferase family 39 protein, partial [Acidobacteriota bacterium]